MSLTGVLEEIAELWDGVTEVRWRVTPPARALLADRPIATETTTEIVREACANAIRHGAAGRVDVVVSLARGRIRVEVANDGVAEGSPEPRGRGLGTVLFDELTLSWSLTVEDGRARFVALLPVL